MFKCVCVYIYMCVCIFVKVCFNYCEAVSCLLSWFKSVMCWWESLLCVSQITARWRCTSWWRPDSSLSSNLTLNTPSWRSEFSTEARGDITSCEPHTRLSFWWHSCEIIAYSKAVCTLRVWDFRRSQSPVFVQPLRDSCWITVDCFHWASWCTPVLK